VRIFAGIGRPAAALVLALAAAACAPPPPETAAPAEQPVSLVAATSSGTVVGKLLGSANEPEVAGERLNGERLRRFYARHGFQPVWSEARQPHATALADTVLRAHEHGLAPALFHGDLLRNVESLSVLDRELILTDAVLAYADALGRGVLPADRRPDDETLSAGPVDVAAALDKALNSPAASAPEAIEALAPETPTYALLREALRDRRAGRLPTTASGLKEATARWRAIEVNLERERWLPRKLPADRVWVNAADQRLALYRDNQPVFGTRVIVGMDDKGNQSPEFTVPIDAIWFNPPWNIPEDIARNEILPKTKGDPDYLAKHNMVLLPDGTLQQRASPFSGLGQLMFDMNNKFEVYLHDTPGKELFKRPERRFSHGCIRVENPRELAALVMQQPLSEIDQAIARGDTVRTPVPKPVPVFVVYQTAFADTDGKLQFRPDVYGRDPAVWQALSPPGRAMAQR